VHCGRGSWGGRRLSLADYVIGTGAPRGATAAGKCLCWLSSKLSDRTTGDRPAVHSDIKALITRMSTAIPLGAPRASMVSC
jgi:hypothetical protein